MIRIRPSGDKLPPRHAFRFFIAGSIFVGMIGAHWPTVAAQPDNPPVPELPPPGRVVFRQAEIVGWAAAEVPKAPPGFDVERFADGLDHPRWMLVLPNGDTLVAQSRTEKLGGMSTEVIDAKDRPPGAP